MSKSQPTHQEIIAAYDALDTHDRDINAAKNILAAGLAVNVCGDRRSLRHSSGDDAALVDEAESSL